MKTVLIIDDNPVITSIYRGKLAAEQLHTEIAGNGEEGLEMLDRCKPDVVLLDLMLPKVNGMDVLKRIRARPEYKSLPVIVFSNSYSADVMQQAWGFGATDVLHKSSTTPRTVVLALVRAIASNSPVSVPVAPATAAAEAPMSPESELTAVLQRLASGDIEAASVDFLRVVHAGIRGDRFPAEMMTLFTALEVLVATANQTSAGPGREPIHDSIRAVSRVTRTMASHAKVAC
jgi:two-component system, chemotaxis family, chemotaxis protein CheY